MIAHAAGAVLIGGIEALRLGSGWLALAILPLFAAVGLLAALAIGGGERLAKDRRWWVAALAIALPSVLVSIPVATTLFDGAYAQTLPLHAALPVLAPVVAWLMTAVAVALGRRLLRSGDLVSRAIALMILAGVFGAIMRIKVHYIGAAYPGAQAGVTIASIVLAGVGVRITRRSGIPRFIAPALVAIVLGATFGALFYGLRTETERERLARYGNATKDVVRIWRDVFDFDSDGSSPVLGGGDCDDFDAKRYPGARDVPGDGIDQDCDGVDAVPPAPPPPPPVEKTDWRADAKVTGMLAAARNLDVVLITVDALRFDLLAPDAPHREDFPNLVKLLDDSVWFTRAISPASGTDIALSTLLTGRGNPFQPITTTLIEAMRTSGRRTYTAIPEEVTRYVGDVLISRGVDKPVKVFTDWQVQDVGDHVSAPTTTLEGIRALDDANGRPAFYWLHYFDVHEHHQIKVEPAALKAVHDTGPGPKSLTYRALLAGIDAEIGHFLAERAKRGLADPIIVFASDHGESLGEEARFGETHGRVTYAPLVRVPLAFHVPGATVGQRLDSASILDVAPTLLGLVGTPDAIPSLDGRDLLPELVDAAAESRKVSRAIVIHEEWQWSVVEWPYQLIVQPAENLVELYDLERDPGEHEDLSQLHADVVARLRLRYSAAPGVRVDRTPAGRQWREQQAQPQATPGPSPGAAANTTP